MLTKLNNWLDGSLLGWRRGYILTHPHKLLHEIWLRIKWAWQRVYRGWDDRVVWSIDFYLAKMIPVWVDQLDKAGIPSKLFEDDDWDNNTSSFKPEAMDRAAKQWDQIVADISTGFRAYSETDTLSFDDPKQPELKQKFEYGFDLFREYFDNLWD
jgi:hypothetical protein